MNYLTVVVISVSPKYLRGFDFFGFFMVNFLFSCLILHSGSWTLDQDFVYGLDLGLPLYDVYDVPSSSLSLS